MKPFRKVKTGDRLLDGVQEAVDEALRPINACPLLDGTIIGPVTFVSGAGTRVSHGLGRKPQGWFLVSPRGDATVWEGTSTSPKLQTVLTASTHLTASFWFF